MDPALMTPQRRAFNRRALSAYLASIAAGGPGSLSSPETQADSLVPRALGAFIHGAPNDPGALDRFVEMIGRRPAVVSWFEAWGSSTAVTGEIIRVGLLESVAERGAIPMITWEPWDPAAGVDQPAYRLATIARGDFDAYINSWAYRLAAYGGPVWLRFAHEMNAPWYPWGVTVNQNSAADYLAVWHHIRGRFQEAGATNVKWIWCVDATTRGELSFAALYPGDDTVDWIALDGYNWGTSMSNTTWRPLVDIFSDAYEEIAGLGARPLMIAEVASAERGGNKATWIGEGFALLPMRFPRIEVVCWFNEQHAVTDWRVESSLHSLSAFVDVVNQPLWSGYPQTSVEEQS